MKVIMGLICLSICLLFVVPSSAQSDTLASNDLIVKLSPQHLMANGLYLELERRILPNSRHSIIAAPQFFYGGTAYIDSYNDRDTDLNENNKIKGLGLSLQHRIYTTEGAPAHQQGMYVGYGVEYHHFGIEFEREGFVEEINEEGLEYYKYRSKPFSENINRVGIIGMGGLQSAFLHKRVVADLSLGIGYRISRITTDYPETLFNIGPTDFGYTGAYVLGILKLGYAFSK